ncbi:MAG TPA: S8 family serine peptidase [Dehalococcoidia bacterium]|nr:S8 family serine peptidase [Dehalococcoidia bacterium]
MMSKLSAAALAALAAIFVAIGTTATPDAQAQGGQRAERTGDVVVRFKPQATLASVAGAIGNARAEAKATTAPSRLVLLHPHAGQPVDDAVAALAADPNVEFAEADVTVHAAATPTDPLYASYQWNLPQMSLPAAWDQTTGSTSVIVAVLDTGVDATHPDLSGRITSGANAGYNFVGNNTNTADDNSHGTFVAGIIGANTNNGQGIAGICWSCKIMPVKVLDSTGTGSMFNLAQGIDWAVSHGAKVINMSLGGVAGETALQTAVDNAWASGAVLIAASGNDNGAVLYPAAYGNVVAVGSLTQAGARSSFSNFGPELDLAAPGESIASTLCLCNGHPGGYGTGSGTSFAAPEVSGIAALMVADGTTNNATIVSQLKSSATDMGVAGYDTSTGWGRPNAAAALGDLTPPSVSIASPAWNAVVSGSLTASVIATDSGGVKVVKFWMDGVYQGNDPTAPYTFQWNTATLTNGPHRILVEADDLSGNKAWAAGNFFVSNDSTAPSVRITSPTWNATVSGTLTATVSATDNVGVKVVKFWMDGVYQGNDATAPYGFQWDTTLLAAGTHRILVEADDLSGNKAWTSVNFIVSNDSTAPAVSITSPTWGSTASGMLAATVSASDNVGVKVVKFWMDGVYQGNDPTAPYGFTWDTTTLSNGTHRILVEADDAAGNKAWAAVNFTVSN